MSGASHANVRAVTDRLRGAQGENVQILFKTQPVWPRTVVLEVPSPVDPEDGLLCP